MNDVTTYVLVAFLAGIIAGVLGTLAAWIFWAR